MNNERELIARAVAMAIVNVKPCESGPDGRHGMVMRAEAGRLIRLAMALSPASLGRLQSDVQSGLRELCVDVEAEARAEAAEREQKNEEWMRQHCPDGGVLVDSSVTAPPVLKLPGAFARCEYLGPAVLKPPADLVLQFLTPRHAAVATIALAARQAVVLLRWIDWARKGCYRSSSAGTQSPMS